MDARQVQLEMRALATYFHDEIRRSSLSGVSTRAALKFFFLGFVPAGKKLARFKPRRKGNPHSQISFYSSVRKGGREELIPVCRWKMSMRFFV